MKRIFSKNVVIATILITVSYVLFALYIMNFRLINQTIIGDYPLTYKTNLLFVLLGGMWTAMTRTALTLLVVTALLTGLNIALLSKRVRSLGGIRNTHVLIGGGSVLGIVGGGCAACGLPLLSLLGLSGSAIYLPFHGTEFSYIAIILLLFSFYTLIKGNKKDQLTCSISKRN